MQTKTCSKCRLLLPIERFAIDPRRGKHVAECKKCRQSRDGAWRRKKLMDPEARRRKNEWHRQYMKGYRMREGSAERLSAYSKRYRNSDRGKLVTMIAQITDPYRDARVALCNAVRDGRVVRPATCSACGKACTPDGHHHAGYDRESWLKVTWLCRHCHRAADRASKNPQSPVRCEK